MYFDDFWHYYLFAKWYYDQRRSEEFPRTWGRLYVVTYLSFIIRYALEKNLAPTIGKKAFEVLLWLGTDIGGLWPHFKKSNTIFSQDMALKKMGELEKLCKGIPELERYVTDVAEYLYEYDYSFLEKQDGEDTADNN
jgi:hypothetical protein